VTDFNSIIEKASIILLVDWPDRNVPQSLVLSGLTVYSYSPNGYSQVFIEKDHPGNQDEDSKSFSTALVEVNNLNFRPVDHPPNAVDIVTIYRPAKEHAEIIAKHVLPLGAKIVWLQPPVESTKTERIAKENGLIFIQGRDIREIIIH